MPEHVQTSHTIQNYATLTYITILTKKKDFFKIPQRIFIWHSFRKLIPEETVLGNVEFLTTLKVDLLGPINKLLHFCTFFFYLHFVF